MSLSYNLLPIEKDDFDEFWDFANQLIEYEKSQTDLKDTDKNLPLSNQVMAYAYAAAVWVERRKNEDLYFKLKWADSSSEEYQKKVQELEKEISKLKRKIRERDRRKAKKSAKGKGV